MLKAWIISLRRKPKAVRERVALGAAVTVSTLIFAGWAATIPFRVADQPTQTANVFGGLFDTVQDELSNFKETIPAPAETPGTESTNTTELNAAITASTSASSSVWTTATATVTTASTSRPVRIATTTVTASGTTTTP